MHYEEFNELNVKFFEHSRSSLLDPLGLNISNDVKWTKEISSSTCQSRHSTHHTEKRIYQEKSHTNHSKHQRPQLHQ